MDLSTALGFRTASSAASAVDQQPAASRSASSRLASLGIGSDQDHGDEGDDSEEGYGQARLPDVSASSWSASLSQGGFPGDTTRARNEGAASGQSSSTSSSALPSLLPRAAACHILLTDDTLDDRRHRSLAGSGLAGGAEDARATAGATGAGGSSAGGSGSGSGSGTSADFLVAHYLFGAIKEGVASAAAAVPSGSKSSSSTSLARPSTGESMAAPAHTTSAAAPGGRRARRRKVVLVDFACRGDAHWAAVGKRMVSPWTGGATGVSAC